MSRFGQTVYLLACLLAAVFLATGLFFAFTEFRDGMSVATGFVIVAIAVLIWMVGYLARNVINAESEKGPRL